MKKLRLLALIFTLLLLTSAFTCGVSPAPQTGFRIHTQYSKLTDCFFCLTHDHPNVIVSGNCKRDAYQTSDDTDYPPCQSPAPNDVTSGYIRTFYDETDENGIYDVVNGRAYAYWTLMEHSGPCSNQSIWTAIAKASTQPLICYVWGSMTFSPNPISVYAQPITAQVIGTGIDATYGMPLIRIYNPDGDLISEVTATSVAPDGTSVEFTMPSLGGQYSGTYGVGVFTFLSSGSLDPIGGATFDTFGNDPPEPPPPAPDDCRQDPRLECQPSEN